MVITKKAELRLLAGKHLILEFQMRKLSREKKYRTDKIFNGFHDESKNKVKSLVYLSSHRY